MPKVSVIIPTYNRAHLIARAIQSVLNQTYQDFEIIVVDDGSTDNTEEVVKGFNDGRIRYIQHEKNKGEAAARNTGIKAARGEYIASQDSDDEWLPEKLRKQMEVFKSASSRVGVVYTGFWRIKDNKKVYTPSSNIKPKEGDIHKNLLKENFIGTPVTLIKKECFHKVGMFNETLPHLVDWEIWIRISKYYQFRCIDEPLLISYYTPDSISADRNALVRARKFILDKYFEDIKKDKRVLANHYLSISAILWANREFQEGESYFAKALRTYPDINKDKKLLSKYYFGIGINLCSNDDFRNWRNYLIKAVKAYPFNIKLLLIVLLLSFGQGFYNKSMKIYRNIKRLIG